VQKLVCKLTKDDQPAGQKKASISSKINKYDGKSLDRAKITLIDQPQK